MGPNSISSIDRGGFEPELGFELELVYGEIAGPPEGGGTSTSDECTPETGGGKVQGVEAKVGVGCDNCDDAVLMLLPDVEPKMRCVMSASDATFLVSSPICCDT